MAIDVREVGDETAPITIDGPQATSTDDASTSTEQLVRVAVAVSLPVIGAAVMTGGMFVGVGARIWGSLAALAGIVLAERARRIRRQGFLYLAIVGGLVVIGLIVVAPTGLSNILDIGSAIRAAQTTSDVLRPPVSFLPGWHAILGLVMAVVGFGAAWIAFEIRRPALGVLVTLVVVGPAAVSLPESQQLGSGLAVLVLFVLSLAVLAGRREEGDSASLGVAFELRRALRALPLIALVAVGLFYASRSEFLFPAPLYDPAQEAKKPKSIPLSEVEDRVLFTVDAKFTGPWKMGSLDVYDGEDWRLPPFSESELNEVPESGIVNEEYRPGVRATFTVRGLGGAILPSLPNTVGVVAEGPVLAYDDRTGNIRLAQGQIAPGFDYVVVAAATPTIERLRGASASVPDEAKAFLEVPDPPSAVAALLRLAPMSNRWDRLDFLRKRLLTTVTAAGAGTPVTVPPETVQDMLAGSKEGTPFEIVAGQAMLARWAGVPSRIGYGFDGGDAGPGGVLEVRPRHGALFLEVFFPDYGWLPIVGDPLQAKESLSDAPQQFNPSVQVSEDVSVRLFIPTLTVEDRTFVEEFRAFALRLAPILAGLLVLYFLWPLPYKAFRRARRRTWAAEQGPEARIALAYAEWRDHATDFGFKHHTDTPLMYLKYVIADQEHAEFAWLITRTLWGDMRAAVGTQDALAAEELSRSLRRRLAQAQPATMRVVAALSRLSVRQPYAPGLDAAARMQGMKTGAAA